MTFFFSLLFCIYIFPLSLIPETEDVAVQEECSTGVALKRQARQHGPPGTARWETEWISVRPWQLRRVEGDRAWNVLLLVNQTDRLMWGGKEEAKKKSAKQLQETNKNNLEWYALFAEEHGNTCCEWVLMRMLLTSSQPFNWVIVLIAAFQLQYLFHPTLVFKRSLVYLCN